MEGLSTASQFLFHRWRKCTHLIEKVHTIDVVDKMEKQDSNAEMEKVHTFDALKPGSLPTDVPSHPEVKGSDLLEETIVELEKKISELNCEGGSEMIMFRNPLFEGAGFNMSWNKLYKIKE